MTSDEQEALSHQHYGLWCVPLASGAVAVFSHPAGRLLEITRWEEVKHLPLPAKPAPAAKRELTLDELFS